MSILLRSTEKLTGLSVNTPNAHHKIILSLFTDDTTVFLSKNDSPKMLFNILDTWCTASGAKFNKTVVLHVGTTEYRENVILNHSLQQLSPPMLPDSMLTLK